MAAGAAFAAGTAAGSVMHGLEAVSPAPDLPAAQMHQGNACMRRRHGAAVKGGSHTCGVDAAMTCQRLHRPRSR